MGWRLRVVHTTEVSYSGPVRTSFNEVRMTPLTIPAQVTLESRVSAGSGVPVWTYCDYWGTYVSVFDISEPHDSLSIRAQATVETGQHLSNHIPAPPSWIDLRHQATSTRLRVPSARTLRCASPLRSPSMRASMTPGGSTRVSSTRMRIR